MRKEKNENFLSVYLPCLCVKGPLHIIIHTKWKICIFTFVRVFMYKKCSPRVFFVLYTHFLGAHSYKTFFFVVNINNSSCIHFFPTCVAEKFSYKNLVVWTYVHTALLYTIYKDIKGNRRQYFDSILILVVSEHG